MAYALSLNPVSVSQWQTGVRQVPAERCPQIERVTGGAIQCEDLRPDVEWWVVRGSKPLPKVPLFDATEIIRRLGGIELTAKLCEVPATTVAKWQDGNRIPKARLMFLRLARPDAFQPRRVTQE